MINITDKVNCCGCNGCRNICPIQCISMVPDEEGFLYPKIDKNKCINCGMCESICPSINDINKVSKNLKTFAAKSRDSILRKSSSSGGIFTEICKYIIDNNGVVFGAKFDKEFNVVHSYAESIEECAKFKGSKYVQSDINTMYSKAKEFLDNGRLVLFSGTQCQIKGLNLFLKKDYKNLISLEVICHGVPSPLVMKLYTEHLKKQYNSTIKSMNFRDKITGWTRFSYSIYFDNGKVHSKTVSEEVYMRGFLKNLYLRPSCHDCKAKNLKSNSDISLADYWGVHKLHPKIDDKKGVSLVLVNSEKGMSIVKKIRPNIIIEETDLDYAIKRNPCIIKSIKSHENREKFFKTINSINIEENIIKQLNL